MEDGFGMSMATFLEGFSALSVWFGDRTYWDPTSDVFSSSMFAFLSNLSIREGLSPERSSFLASSISSGDIFAIRCLFSSSILRASSALGGFPLPILGVSGIPFWLRLGSRAVEFAGLLIGGDCSTLLRLKVDCLLRFLCAGKPVSALLFSGRDGGFELGENDRSLTSPTKLEGILGANARFVGLTASVSSSEDKSM